MVRLPVDPAEAWDTWTEATHAAEAASFIVAVGDEDLLRAADVAIGGETVLRRSSLGLDRLDSIGLGAEEILLVMIQPGDEDRILPGLRKAILPLGAVLAVDDGPAATYEVSHYESNVVRVSFAPDEDGWDAVRRALVECGEAHLVPLGRRYGGLRREAGHRLVLRTAKQNGVIAVAFFMPGTDMPLMTLNQIKLVLGLAAMYGQELNQERALELLAVLGIGFTFRTLARQVVDLIPGPGVAWKAGIGYTGTVAMGEAAIRYFEEGAPATPSRIAKALRRLRR